MTTFRSSPYVTSIPFYFLPPIISYQLTLPKVPIYHAQKLFFLYKKQVCICSGFFVCHIEFVVWHLGGQHTGHKIKTGFYRWHTRAFIIAFATGRHYRHAALNKSVQQNTGGQVDAYRLSYYLRHHDTPDKFCEPFNVLDMPVSFWHL